LLRLHCNGRTIGIRQIEPIMILVLRFILDQSAHVSHSSQSHPSVSADQTVSIAKAVQNATVEFLQHHVPGHIDIVCYGSGSGWSYSSVHCSSLVRACGQECRSALVRTDRGWQDDVALAPVRRRQTRRRPPKRQLQASALFRNAVPNSRGGCVTSHR
jgi:hypothetical protein